MDDDEVGWGKRLQARYPHALGRIESYNLSCPPGWRRLAKGLVARVEDYAQTVLAQGGSASEATRVVQIKEKYGELREVRRAALLHVERARVAARPRRCRHRRLAQRLPRVRRPGPARVAQRLDRRRVPQPRGRCDAGLDRRPRRAHHARSDRRARPPRRLRACLPAEAASRARRRGLTGCRPCGLSAKSTPSTEQGFGAGRPHGRTASCVCRCRCVGTGSRPGRWCARTRPRWTPGLMPLSTRAMPQLPRLPAQPGQSMPRLGGRGASAGHSDGRGRLPQPGRKAGNLLREAAAERAQHEPNDADGLPIKKLKALR